ncbi:TonB-linked SusC/RagA family outer membrane protein [Filimonas zeae]|nr:TonB-dependent receptor [Filimonas zeae]MDR6338101.1 TonB-linked SusC/RagA family outer membrane protein [Filimonas zeae]
MRKGLLTCPCIVHFSPIIPCGLVTLLLVMASVCIVRASPCRGHLAQTVSGKVTDENGQPMTGVSVLVKEGKAATQTNAAGNYTLTLATPNSILVFSAVGYEKQEIPVNGSDTVNAQMKAINNSLNDVIVVGYGTQKKRDVTGAVVSANLTDFKNAPNANIAQALQGTVPGLNVGQVNSAGSTPNISIRGANTISGNSRVLIVLDGIQYNGSFEAINPDDIASIDVLKDASATAVYGAQAANGVLLITSRRGKKGDKPRVAISSSYATQSPRGNIRPMNRAEYLQHIRDLYYEEAYLGPDYTQPNPNFNIASRVDPSLKNTSDQLLPNDFSWWDAGTRTGSIADHQLSVSGGGDKVNYLISVNYTDQKGFIRNDDFKRKGIRVNLETQIASWWKAGIQSFGSFVNKDGSEPSVGGLFTFAPLAVPYDTAGRLIPYPFNTNLTNPFHGYYTDDLERHNYFFANLYTEISIPFIKGLSYRLNYGNNYRINQQYNASIYGAGLTGSASKEFESYYDYTLDNIVTYNRAFKKHDVNVTLLYGAVERNNDYTLSNANGFSRLTLGYNSLELGTNRFANSDAWSEALAYQMARVSYKYDNKYLLTATLRRDGFSGFAANHKYGTFPSAALGWIASNESFMKVSWLDYLKVRAGYGISGNQTSRYFSLSRVSSGAAYVFGDGGSTVFGQQVQSLANPNLRWERTAGINAGVDFALFQDRLSGSLDYYQTDTKDLLFNVNIPAITGFGTISTNVGNIRNRGVELSLTSKNVDLKNFTWRTTVTFSRNVNKILQLIGSGDMTASSLFIGKSINSLYGYQANGIYQLGETPPAGYYVGTYRVADNTKDGNITPADRVILGYGEPAYRISMLNSFDYKGFSFTIFFNSVQGGKNGYRGSNSPTKIRDDNGVRNNYQHTIDFWSPRNPNGKYARSAVSPTITPTIYQDRSFIRLQDVSLSYRFTGAWVNKLKFQNLNLYVSGKNLATWTNWEGWDPETNQGLTNDGRPVLKGYSLGINATF